MQGTTLKIFQVGNITAHIQLDLHTAGLKPAVVLGRVAEPGQTGTREAQYELHEMPLVQEALRLANNWLRDYLWLIESETPNGEETDKDIFEAIAATRDALKLPESGQSAQKWWQSFEAENKQQPGLILKLMKVLERREATAEEFFLSYVYSRTDNISANLCYLDFQRLSSRSKPASVTPGVMEYSMAPEVPDENGRLETLLNDLSARLAPSKASAEAQSWWQERRAEWNDARGSLLMILSDFVTAEATLEELFDAATAADSDDLLALVPYLRHFRSVRAALQAKRGEMRLSTKSAQRVDQFLSALWEFQRSRRTGNKAGEAQEAKMENVPAEAENLPEQMRDWVTALQIYPGEFHKDLFDFIRREINFAFRAQSAELSITERKELAAAFSRACMFLIHENDILNAMGSGYMGSLDTMIQ